MNTSTDFFFNENGITSEGESVAQTQADDELTSLGNTIVEPGAPEEECPEIDVIELKITDIEDRLIKLEAELLFLLNNTDKKSKNKKKIISDNEDKSIEKTEDQSEDEIKEKFKVEKKDKSKKKHKKKHKNK